MAHPSTTPRARRDADDSPDSRSPNATPERSSAPDETTTTPRLGDSGAHWIAAHPGTLVLVVENEESNRILMERILKLAGYRCVTASNGSEALVKFDKHHPDIVLTDIAMPIMDGLEAIERIRARPAGATVPIVAVTAYAMAGDRELALRQGCDEYLAKPYHPHDLLELVARLLKEASA